MPSRTPSRSLALLLLLPLLLVPVCVGADEEKKNVRGSSRKKAGKTRVDELLKKFQQGTPDERVAARKALLKLGDEALYGVTRQILRTERHLRSLQNLRRDLISTLGLPGDDASEAFLPAAWFEAKANRARQQLAAGDHLTCVQLVNAVLTVEPNAPNKKLLLQLRRRAEEMLLQESVLSSRLVPRYRVFHPGEPIDCVIRLRNQSEKVVTLKTPPQPGPHTVGVIAIVEEEFSFSGHRARRTFRQTVTLDASLSLLPGEEKEIHVTLERSPKPTAPGVIRRYTLKGALRPYQLLEGDQPYSRFLPLLPVRVAALENEYEKLGTDPWGQFEVALAESLLYGESPNGDAARRRLFRVALLLPSLREAEVSEMLIERLKSADPRTANVIMVLLSFLHDQFKNTDRSYWLSKGRAPDDER